jgi:hypothetical protein
MPRARPALASSLVLLGRSAVALMLRRLLFTARAQLVLPQAQPAPRRRAGARLPGEGACRIAGASLDRAP